MSADLVRARARVKAAGPAAIEPRAVARARRAVASATVEQACADIDDESRRREDRRTLRSSGRGLAWEANRRCHGCRKWTRSNARCSCGWDPLVGAYT